MTGSKSSSVTAPLLSALARRGEPPPNCLAVLAPLFSVFLMTLQNGVSSGPPEEHYPLAGLLALHKTSSMPTSLSLCIRLLDYF